MGGGAGGPNQASVHFATARKSENARYTRLGSLSETSRKSTYDKRDGLMD
jgi:hypothetical protein